MQITTVTHMSQKTEESSKKSTRNTSKQFEPTTQAKHTHTHTHTQMQAHILQIQKPKKEKKIKNKKK